MDGPIPMDQVLDVLHPVALVVVVVVDGDDYDDDVGGDGRRL